jgi:alpha-glucosidase
MKILMLPFIMLSMIITLHAKEYSVQSPSGEITLNVSVEDLIHYSVTFKGMDIISPSPISMEIDGEMLGRNAKVRRDKTISVDEEIIPVVARKNSRIADKYNHLTLSFNNYNLHFRAYNDGVAYRWEVTKKGPMKVISELAAFTFPADYKVWFPEEESMFSHQERSYLDVKLSEITPERFASTGLLVDCGSNVKVFISESDLITDYAGMFLKGSAENPFGLKENSPGLYWRKNRLTIEMWFR